MLNVEWLLVVGERGLMVVAVEETRGDVGGWTVVEEDHHSFSAPCRSPHSETVRIYASPLSCCLSDRM